MELLTPSMEMLFAQLGEAADAPSIARFIDHHGPLDSHTAVHEATCWSVSQATFLLDATTLDANWAAVVDTLNVLLHQAPELPLCATQH